MAPSFESIASHSLRLLYEPASKLGRLMWYFQMVVNTVERIVLSSTVTIALLLRHNWRLNNWIKSIIWLFYFDQNWKSQCLTVKLKQRLSSLSKFNMRLKLLLERSLIPTIQLHSAQKFNFKLKTSDAVKDFPYCTWKFYTAAIFCVMELNKDRGWLKLVLVSHCTLLFHISKLQVSL